MRKELPLTHNRPRHVLEHETWQNQIAWFFFLFTVMAPRPFILRVILYLKTLKNSLYKNICSGKNKSTVLVFIFVIVRINLF